MESNKKSETRKRGYESDLDRNKGKKFCLEEYFTANMADETIINKFQDQLRKLQEDITFKKLKNVTEAIKLLKRRDLLEVLDVVDGLRVVNTLIKFIKNGFIMNLHRGKEWDLKTWKSYAETSFEASLICLYFLENEKMLDSDIDYYTNDLIFFLRKIFDDLNEQFSKTNVKIFNEPGVNDILLQNLNFINELIKIRNLNSLNLTELITSFMSTFFYSSDDDVRNSILLGLLSFYKKGEEFQALILNLLFKTVKKFHHNYKFKKNYKISTTRSVSSFTFLIMTLVENVPVLGFDTLDSSSGLQKNFSLLSDSCNTLKKVICFIINTFIKGVSTHHESEKVLNLFLCRLVAELIEVCNEPEWPSARLILNYLLKPLTEILCLTPPANSRLRILAVKNLGEILRKQICDKIIFSKLVEHLKQDFKGSDFTNYSQKLLIHALDKSNITGVNKNCKFLHAMQWFDNIKTHVKSEEKTLDLIKLVTEQVMDATLKEEEIRAVVYYLDTKRHNYTDHCVVVKYLLGSCNDRNKKVKITANGYLFELTTLDPDLLSQSMISKIVRENIFLSAPSTKEKICAAMEKFLIKYPDKGSEYLPFLLKFLDGLAVSVKNICIDLIMKITENQRDKVFAWHKILCLMQSTDPIIQGKVVDVLSPKWLGRESQEDGNLNVLFDIVVMPNGSKCLKLFFEEKLKPSGTFSQSSGETVQLFLDLMNKILVKINKSEKVEECLQVLSILVKVCPPTLIPHILLVAGLLGRPAYSKNFREEILAAELLNCAVPKIVNPDLLTFISVRDEVLRKLATPQSLNFPMGLHVSLVKLLNTLSKFDKIFLYENSFKPNLKLLNEYYNTQTAGDIRLIHRALCTVILLHIHFPNESENFPLLFQYFIENPMFTATTIHCLCYLSIEHKSIMRNEIVIKTIEKYLRDRQDTLLVKGVLFNILYSLKYINKGQVTGDNIDIEPVIKIVEKHFTDIMNCASDENIEIRQTAYSLIKQLFQAGIVQENRLIPRIILMSVDPVDRLADIGHEALAMVRRKKLFDFVSKTEKCLLAALAFNLTCSKGHARGYKTVDNNVVAVCDHLYVPYQEEVISRRLMIDSIFNGLNTNARTRLIDKLYLADNLTFFTYKYQEEVLYVLEQIVIMSATPVVQGEDKIKFVNKYYGMYILQYVKAHLMSQYGFKEGKIEKYQQKDSKNDLIQFKAVSSHSIPESSLPWNVDYEDLAKKILKIFSKSKD